MYNGKITIKETSKEDLENVMKLWNSGEVMFYVGFPNGFGTTIEKLRDWLPWVINKPKRCHYSIYAENVGYCGETFYNVDEEHELAAVDIKLLPIAQGKGIACRALSYAIDKAFFVGKAKRVYVDPHPDNKKAWKLYANLGFISTERPNYLEEGDTYLEISSESWIMHKGSLEGV